MPGAGFITPAGDPGKVKGLLARMDRNVDRQAARRAGKGKS